jgi:apolipoprotein N-acyltransferase
MMSDEFFGGRTYEGLGRSNGGRGVEVGVTTAVAVSEGSTHEGMGTWRAAMWAGVAVGAFHLAYEVPGIGLLMGVYLFGLVKLTEVGAARGAFWWGMAVGLACVVPQLWFFWGVFGGAAVALWAVLAFWIGLFVLIGWGLRQVAWVKGWFLAFMLAVVWMGLEYFRCELYWLRFAWLTVGMACPSVVVSWTGVYGAGLVLMILMALLAQARRWMPWGVLVVGVALWALWPTLNKDGSGAIGERVVGIQLEGPSEGEVVEALDTAVSAYPDAALLVMPEYTLMSPPPERIRAWCRRNERYLVIGGKLPLEDRPDGEGKWSNTAFVIDPKGEVVFTQGKCVPIQFFDDGVAAKEQRLWDSPWGKVGICICYDLSYTRVTDELIRQGAQYLIVPTMDAVSWGAHEHKLHVRVAEVRYAEYGVRLIRVASSGISQIKWYFGEGPTAPYPGQGAMVTAKCLRPGARGGTIPWDRWVAPVCVGVTGIVVVMLLGREGRRRWGRRSTE